MIRILAVSALAALPALASAASLRDTHEQVSSPNKATVAYRPIAARPAAPAKCHPEASKAIGCEAQAAIARNRALVRAGAENEAPSSGR